MVAGGGGWRGGAGTGGLWLVAGALSCLGGSVRDALRYAIKVLLKQP